MSEKRKKNVAPMDDEELWSPLSPSLCVEENEDVNRFLNSVELVDDDLLCKLEETLASIPSTSEQSLLPIVPDEFENLCQQQRELRFPFDPNQLQQMDKKYKALKDTAEKILQNLEEKTKITLLNSQDWFKIWIQKQDCLLQLKRIEVCRQELHEMTRERFPKVLALAIVRQALPQVLMRGRKFSYPISVQLIFGPRIQIASLSSSRAVLVSEEYPNKSVYSLENDKADFGTSFLATFADMKVNTGTMQRKVKLQFYTEVSVYNVDEEPHTAQKKTITSDLSHPLIIMTHQSQWTDAQSKVLLSDFNCGSTMTWTQFHNLLHKTYFLIFAKECSTSKTFRMLSPQDLDFIKKKLGNESYITTGLFTSFWDWFGKVLYQVHNPRYYAFWLKGVIYGFVTRQESEYLLEEKPNGTFLVRFSENVAGKLAISYKDKEGVHHYLLSEEDQRKCLLDCMSEKHRLSVLLKYRYFGGGDDAITIFPCAKEDLDKEFQRTKRKKQTRVTDALGYEPYIE